MLTYQLKKEPGLPLYEALYRCIREDIVTGQLPPGTRLPSKRALSEHLKVSKITVEGAYNQLLSEGYIRSREKVGYFVESVERPRAVTPPAPAPVPQNSPFRGGQFPFSVWSRLQREVMLDYREGLLRPMPNLGIYDLRLAISRYLAAFRGMRVAPEQILVGAGTDFLYNLLIQLLGRDVAYAVEEPGYRKIRRIYAAGGVTTLSAPLDSQGVRPDALGNARVLHISPSHHFPTGLITPVSRRLELTAWARSRGGWIIEDDYDTEFRFDARPLPAMQTLAPDRVIYMNSFSKTLAPSIRISYMVLPEGLMDRFQQQLGFYSCTVPSFEQYTLARFLSQGYFEKHLNRMRKFYRSRRNRMVSLVRGSDIARRLKLLEQDAGLHFLLNLDTGLTDEALQQQLTARGIPIQTLSHFYHTPPEESTHTLVVNYAEFGEDTMEELLDALKEILM